jgi:hypothetical protein
MDGPKLCCFFGVSQSLDSPGWASDSGPSVPAIQPPLPNTRDPAPVIEKQCPRMEESEQSGNE